jgi:hypothetical protein
VAAGARNILSEIYSFPNRAPGYCQNQNVTKTVTARVQNANALGLKMAARNSEVGCNTPQKWQRMASDDTVDEQFLQVRFDLRMARREENPTRASMSLKLAGKELGKGLGKDRC